jgi:hypothetical protein
VIGMIANLLNTLIGLGLTYTAILHPSLLEGRGWLLLIVAAIIFVTAWVARRSDFHPWQNNANMAVAALLALFAALALGHFPVAQFWGEFSTGTIVAVLALWAALYRPRSSQP